MIFLSTGISINFWFNWFVWNVIPADLIYLPISLAVYSAHLSIKLASILQYSHLNTRWINIIFYIF